MKKAELQFLLKKYGIQPRREQGQNFLLDDDVIEDTVRAARLDPADTILEIGPGFGMLTMKLAESGARTIAVEQDRDIFPAIQKIALQFPNVELHNANIQQLPLASILEDRKYKLVANLPYQISSWVLKHFLAYPPRPTLLVIMVQKEVAERVTATPGAMSILSCAVQLYGIPEIVRLVPHTSFYPAPQVDSAILKITTHQKPFMEDPEQLMRLIRIGFSAKRKQLHNNFMAGLRLTQENVQEKMKKAGIVTPVRPQELSLEQWIALYTQFAADVQ